MPGRESGSASGQPGKAKVVSAAPLNVLAFRSPLWELSDGDATAPDRVTWTIQHRKRTPIIVRIDKPPTSGLFVLNDKPFAYLDRSGPRQVWAELRNGPS